MTETERFVVTQRIAGDLLRLCNDREGSQPRMVKASLRVAEVVVGVAEGLLHVIRYVPEEAEPRPYVDALYKTAGASIAHDPEAMEIFRRAAHQAQLKEES
jgi:hypothetical protein